MMNVEDHKANHTLSFVVFLIIEYAGIKKVIRFQGGL